MLNKRCLRGISLLLHGCYGMACAVLVLCWKTRLVTGDIIDIHFTLDLWYQLFMSLVPLLTLGIVLNILAMPPKKSGKHGKVGWTLWTILAPILLVIFLLVPTNILFSSGGWMS